MSATPARRRLAALLLVTPLVLFLAVFFLWPLVTMLTAAFVDESVSGAFPRTAEQLADWEGEGLPPPEAQAALVADLRAAAQDQQRFGNAVRRLNSDQPGFRSLFGKTLTAVRGLAEDAPVELLEIDARWGETSYWLTLKRAVEPFSDSNILATLDLQRNAAGEIVAMPEGSSANLAILWRTFEISLLVTLLCLAIGLPYALLIARAGGLLRTLLLLAVLVPLWTSLLVRTTAWVILLQNEGLINKALQWMNLIAEPLPLIFNRAGVLIAMTQVLLPFMVLPIYSVVAGIPKNLVPAAASLGARPLRAFWHVLLPLAVPGILSGALLVFMVALGYYITPALVGGPTDQMISSVIAFYAMGTANWGQAGAFGLILIVATLAIYFLYGRLARSNPLFGG